MKKTEYDVKEEIDLSAFEHLNKVFNSSSVSEIGDGNINRVFRVKDANTSFVVKYAPESAVILPTIKLDRKRGEREGKYLSLAEKYAKGMLPEVYFYDEKRYMLFIEDFGEVKTLSDTLISGDYSSFDADKMANFTADTCFFTSCYTKEMPEEANDSIFAFHDLCLLTKELVFEQPYFDHSNNHFMMENKSFVEKNVYESSLIRQTVEELKKDFMNNHEAIIHGDLHGASIFSVNRRNIVFDGEFSYNGPIAYDTGNVVAHLMMTFFRHSVTNKTDADNADRIIIKAFEYLDLFEKRFSYLLERYGKDEFSNDKTIIENIRKYTFKYAATECLRRVIGLAKSPIFTKDLSESDRAKIERCLIITGCKLLKNDYLFSSEQKLLVFCKTTFTEGIETN